MNGFQALRKASMFSSKNVYVPTKNFINSCKRRKNMLKYHQCIRSIDDICKADDWGLGFYKKG